MIKLLLVEDDASLAYIEKTGLEDIIGGYTVTTATNGKEGLQAWQETNPDVIISDIDMPVMNGFEMVERIRETDQDVIIIFTSALTSPNDVKAGYRLGINNYVKKPFVPEELDAHIQALMKMRASVRRRSCSCWQRTRTTSCGERRSSADSGTPKTITSPPVPSMSSSTNSASSSPTNLASPSKPSAASAYNSWYRNIRHGLHGFYQRHGLLRIRKAVSLII